MITSQYDKDIAHFKQMQFDIAHEEYAAGHSRTELYPVLLILVKDPKQNKLGLVLGDIDMRFFASEDDKEALAKFFVPQVFQRIAAEGLIPICVGWRMESWLRNLPLEKRAQFNSMEAVVEQYGQGYIDSLPRKEVLVFTFETAYSVESTIFSIDRTGDKVVLHDMGEPEGGAKVLEGRFIGYLRQAASLS